MKKKVVENFNFNLLLCDDGDGGDRLQTKRSDL